MRRKIPLSDPSQTRRTMALGKSAYLAAGGVILIIFIGATAYNLRHSAVTPDELGAASAPIVTADTPCVSVLSPATNALVVNSGAQVHATGCILAVKSQATPAAVFNSGTTLDAARICVASDQVTQNARNLSTLNLNCPVAVPDTASLAAPANEPCNDQPKALDGVDVHLQPGTYCGGLAFNNASSHVTFSPGVYVLKGGDWTVDGGTWSGMGVTFYFADASKIQFNSGVAVDLRAPLAGPYRNLLMFEAPGLPASPFIFNDSRLMRLDGVVWLPSRDMVFNSGSRLDSHGLMLGVHSLVLDQTRWNVSPLS